MICFEQLAAITGGRVLQSAQPQARITELATDSRAALLWHEALFFAIVGQHQNGHQFLSHAWQRGCRQFVVQQPIDLAGWEEANVLLVNDSVQALQVLAAWHRQQFSIPVIGITGSNGKTIVKEWLSQMLAPRFSIVKSPGSYNSQIGVPLSVWNMAPHHNLAIFEAGISQRGEMQALARVIAPSIGIFTNLGMAHDEGFENRSEKLQEKLRLFDSTQLVIAHADSPQFAEVVAQLGNDRVLGWHLHALPAAGMHRFDLAGYSPVQLYLPFADRASLQNVGHCLAACMLLSLQTESLQEAVLHLRNQPMRLELKRGLNNCYLIDDSYSSDMESLQVALGFMSQQPLGGRSKMAIITEPAQTRLPARQLHQALAQALSVNNIQEVWAVGGSFAEYKDLYRQPPTCFDNTQALIDWLPAHLPEDRVILIKGARSWQLEQVGALMAEKLHGTVMEINLNALLHNFNFYRSIIPRQTRIMVMVKAFAYGSGSFEVANLLQHHRADYLAVAYTDEGVELRRQGITLPIMVMNASAHQAEALVRYRLEPSVFSKDMIAGLGHFLEQRQMPLNVHLEFDTGMRRLGFEQGETQAVLALLAQYPQLKVAGVFSHLAGADEEIHNDYSLMQIATFEGICQELQTGLGYTFIRHILNSAGIVRFPQASFDMVRLGIGLYGVEVNDLEQDRLQAVATLKTVVSQIREVAPGQTVGYSRKGVAEQPMRIATIAIGYADGYSRAFSNGVGQVLINGSPAPVMGNVCMDMTMVDVTNVPAAVGDEVIVYGQSQPISELAQKIGTIPYELLTNVSARVRRVFIKD